MLLTLNLCSDGRKNYPINHGLTTPENFLKVRTSVSIARVQEKVGMEEGVVAVFLKKLLMVFAPCCLLLFFGYFCVVVVVGFFYFALSLSIYLIDIYISLLISIVVFIRCGFK